MSFLTLNQMREALRAKITSKEQLDRIIVQGIYNKEYVGTPAEKNDAGRIVRSEQFYHINHGAFVPISPQWTEFSQRTGFTLSMSTARLLSSGALQLVNGLHHTRWWLMREWMRMYYGVYDLSPPLAQVARYRPGLAIHCALDGDDRSMVAYTPDPAAGEADRQVRTSLGKLLRKLFPEWPDDLIRDIEAAHRADMSDEVEFITGADAMVNAYLEGPDSCMKKPRGHWADKIGVDRHPIEAYDMPGFALAIARDGAGRVNARAMTWVNPDDENDKRYVRVYGDMCLARRLQRRGYRCAGLAGARLKRIEVIGGRFVMPYVDVPGGGGSGVQDSSASYALLEPNAWYLVPETATHRVVRTLGTSLVGVQTQQGYVTPSTSQIEAHERGLKRICALSKREVSILVESMERAIIDGAWVDVSASALEEASHTATRVYAVHPDQGLVGVYAFGDVKTFVYGGSRYLDGRAEREHCGFEQLDAELYPERKGEWVREAAVQAWEDGGYRTILACDAVDVIELNSDGGKSANPTLPAALWRTRFGPRIEGNNAYTRITRLRSNIPTFAHKDVKISRTVSGRQVVEGVHPVARTIDGQLDFTRNLKQITILGQSTFYHQPASALREVAISDEFKQQVLRWIDGFMGHAAGLWSADEAAARAELAAITGSRLCRHAGLYYYWRKVDGRFEPMEINSIRPERLALAFQAAEEIARDPSAVPSDVPARYNLRHEDAAWFMLELRKAVHRAVHGDQCDEPAAESNEERFVVVAG